MKEIFKKRLTARMDGEFVVFLIGMRMNKPWKIHKWMPIVMAMPKMLKELEKKKEWGFLGAEQSLGMIVQYWESFEKLEAYARSKDGLHFPAWVEFNKKVKSSGDVGIWHETYIIKPGCYEAIYHNMPKYGLGKVGELVTASGNLESAGGRRENLAAKNVS